MIIIATNSSTSLSRAVLAILCAVALSYVAGLYVFAFIPLLRADGVLP